MHILPRLGHNGVRTACVRVRVMARVTALGHETVYNRISRQGCFHNALTHNIKHYQASSQRGSSCQDLGQRVCILCRGSEAGLVSGSL